MSRPRGAISLLSLLLAACALFPLLLKAEDGATAAVQPPPPAARNHNPYDARLATLEGQLTGATPPRAAVLLAQAYKLRETVNDAAAVTRLLERAAADARQHPLVRDEALRYLALIDAHTNQLAAAETKLVDLGFVRNWAVIGPFAAQNISAPVGPEAGHREGETFRDAAGNRRSWRALPLAGPQMWNDLAPRYAHNGSRVAVASSAVYSEQARTVTLRFTADSALAVFVNGRQVFTDANSWGVAFDQHAVSVALQAGWNEIGLKLAHSGDGPWRFALRTTAPEGGGIPLPSASSAKPNSASAPTATANQLAAPQDLLDMAKAAADAEPASATALETLGRMEREHARGESFQHLEAAARRSPSAERWTAVAEDCSDSACVFTALNAALRAEPENEPAQLALANYYFGRGQLEKARDVLRTALRLAPDDFVARNGLADLYVAVGLQSEALRQAEQLEKDFPGPLWLKRKLAGRYLDFGLLERAHAILLRALEGNFDGRQERALLLRIYERRRDAAGLRAAYEAMRQLHPGDPAPLAELAALESGADHHAEAASFMQKALALAPEDDDLHDRFANLLARAGKLQAASAELQRAVALNPNRQEARRRLELASGAGSDSEAAYLAEPEVLVADARRSPPATTANAVALANVRVERVYENGLSAVREQQIYYLATRQGVRDFSTRSVQYSPGTQELRVLHARVYKRDGRVLEGDEGAEGGVADTSVAMYYDVRSRVVHFPALEIGDVVELDYRLSPATNDNPYGDYFGGLVVFRSNLPQQLQRYVLITPARRQFNILETRMMRASVTDAGEQRVYRWEVRDMLTLPAEPRGPALTDVAPYVHVSTFRSWDDVGRWYAQLIQPQFALDGSLREQADRLLRSARTEPERISAIHQFVLRNTHYVAMEFGIYSYKPYPVSQVYARRFGDCKDKASLMIALLRQAGIEAEFALVRTRRLGEIAPQATSIALFNHAIVYLPKYDLWLDGTAEYAGSRELPLEDQGATALTVAQDGRATLRHIPVTQANDNYTRRTVRAQVMPDGRIAFNGVIYTRGEDAPGLRRDYETPERQRDAVRNALAEVFPSVKVDDVRVDGANDLEHPVTVEFRGALDTFAGRTLVPLAASWMPRSYVQQLAAQASRQQDLLLPAPWTTEEELHFELPAGATVRGIPADTVLQSEFGAATLHYQRKGRELVIRTSVQFRSLHIAAADYEQFREFCRQVERAFHYEVKVGLRG